MSLNVTASWSLSCFDHGHEVSYNLSSKSQCSRLFSDCRKMMKSISLMLKDTDVDLNVTSSLVFVVCVYTVFHHSSVFTVETMKASERYYSRKKLCLFVAGAENFSAYSPESCHPPVSTFVKKTPKSPSVRGSFNLDHFVLNVYSTTCIMQTQQRREAFLTSLKAFLTFPFTVM